MSAPRAGKIVLQKESSLQKKTPVAAVPKKTAPKKKSHKLKLVEHKKTGDATIAIANKIVRTVGKPQVTALAIPSPYRFPLPRTESLTLIARVIGLCFVITGTILSALTLGAQSGTFAKLDVERQAAQLVNTGDTNVTAPSVPAIVIRIPNEPLRDVVTVTITGEVDHVELFAQGAGSALKLGGAKRTDTPSVWQLAWDTRQLANGEYRVYAVASKGGQSYQKAFERSVRVENVVPQSNQGSVGDVSIPETNSTATAGDGDSGNQTTTTIAPLEPEVPPSNTTTTTVTPPPNTPTSPTTPTVSLTVSQGALSGSVPVAVQVAGAQSVRIAAYSAATGALYHAGTAIKSSETEWILMWNTRHVTDGTYRLVAFARVQGVEYESARTTVRVENADQNTVPPVPPEEEPLEEPDEPLQTPITLSLLKESPVSEYVPVVITTDTARSVELYRQPLHSFAPFFVGKAQRGEGGKWNFVWNTRETPNGDYLVFARVTTEYGSADSAKTRVQVQNATLGAFTDDQIQAIDTLTGASESLIQPTATQASESVMPNVVYIEPAEVFAAGIETYDDETRGALTTLLREFRMRLDTEINILAGALRAEDTTLIEDTRASIEVLKNEILERLPESEDKEAVLNRVGEYLDMITEELDALTVRNTALLKERIGDAVLMDSDKDGISDYDELHLYQTNPFTADTDGDGFIDSVEITQGFNPHDVRSEALIAYESPQETGVIREDLLEVQSVSTLIFERNEDESEVQALFSGRGLPNSFVTLYIYSTPIVVTVKTDTDGNWNYILDKDLEDGEHEVYIGITDNAGRLVAKSSPLPFVRTAEAYTSAGLNMLPTTDAESTPAFISTNALLLAGSLLVVVLGLALLLIGVMARPRPEMTTPAPAV
jgi:hypothetical protein